MKKTILTLIAFCLILNAWASFKVGGLYYINTSSATQKTVGVVTSGTTYTGAIIIPSSITYNSDTYSVTSICALAFLENTGLTSVVIPSSIDSIYNGAFEGCTGLTSITIPSSVEYIGTGSFADCSNLTTVNYNAVKCDRHSSTLAIGTVFSNASLLTTINIGDSVTKIPDYVFGNCPALRSITIPSSIDTIGDYAFIGSALDSVIIPSSVKYLGIGVFENCSSLKNVSIPTSVTSIRDYSFWGCSSLVTFSIPSSVISLGATAFCSCTALKSITIPSSIDSIKSNTFRGCTSLTLGAFPSSVVYIGSSALYGCTAITSFFVPSSVNYIGDYAFGNCSGLRSVIAEASSPAQCSSTTFDGVSTNTCVLHVPSGSSSLYKYAKGWRDFYNATVEDSTTTTVFNAKNSRIKATVQNGQAVIKDVQVGRNIAIYNLQGVVVYRGKAEAETVSIPLLTQGVYVLLVEDQSIKLVY